MSKPTELLAQTPLRSQTSPLQAALTLAASFPGLAATALDVRGGHLMVHLHLADVAAFDEWVESLRLSVETPLQYEHLGLMRETWTATGAWAEVPLTVKAYPAWPVAALVEAAA
ncbi:hypothetical protein [Streptomyces sp. Y1]|uniref:Uncharacterized protein n=1 Tax=Streptomyces sp. Y1 TaxID=3238634 RepID=A0AB39TJF0_9ACTN